MSHSHLAQVVLLSPNCTKPRNHKIDTITVHHAGGRIGVESLGQVFQPMERQASSNYGIGYDGRIGCYVEEENRSWCSGDRDNDHRAITIEVSNADFGPEGKVSPESYAALIELCTDICRRHGFRLNYTGDTTGNLTMHRWFQATDCPGAYLSVRFPNIAAEVNRRLDGEAAPGEASEGDAAAWGHAALPELKKGSEGGQVKAMQILLCGYGYPCGAYGPRADGADGIFGAATERALKSWQRAVGLSADGICGPRSWEKLLGVK